MPNEIIINNISSQDKSFFYKKVSSEHYFQDLEQIQREGTQMSKINLECILQQETTRKINDN